MTPEEMDAAVARILKASCAAQGLPEKVTDPAVIAKVAALAKPSTFSPATLPGGRSAATPPSPSGSPPSGPSGVSVDAGEAPPSRPAA